MRQVPHKITDVHEMNGSTWVIGTKCIFKQTGRRFNKTPFKLNFAEASMTLDKDVIVFDRNRILRFTGNSLTPHSLDGITEIPGASSVTAAAVSPLGLVVSANIHGERGVYRIVNGRPVALLHTGVDRVDTMVPTEDGVAFRVHESVVTVHGDLSKKRTHAPDIRSRVEGSLKPVDGDPSLFVLDKRARIASW